MTNQITQTISTFIEGQLPEFVREGNPTFVAFIKAYYEWMASGNNAVVRDTFQLMSYKDIDATTNQFIQYFLNDFIPYFPNDTALDERKLIKIARQFYQKKGSVESVKFLFRVLFNKEADIYFPSDNILRTSAGKWVLPQALTLVVSTQDRNFDITQLIGRQGVGSVSNATCVIESATFAIDPGLGIEILEIFVSNLVGTFSDLESLIINYGTQNDNPLVFSEKIIASLSSIQVDPNNRGLKYKGTSSIYAGDPVVITGGLQLGDTLATKAVAFVNTVTSGSITGITILNGGYDYRVSPNTRVNVINAPGDTTGTGANVVVSAIDAPNSIFVFINTDAITLKAAKTLGSSDYGFANIANANANTTLGSAFTYANLQFAPIQTMNVVNGGGAYTQTPTLQTDVTYFTDWTNQLEAIPDFLDAANSVQFVNDLGFVANVFIQSGGNGYDPTKDKIVVPSCIGYGANFSFTVDGSGSINSITVLNAGQGYFYLPYDLAVANSANTQNAASGTGAVLTAYGFGQGAQLQVSVNKIGQILDIRMASRGFDYISTPRISLRIEDLVILDSGSNLTFDTDSVAFQGSNSNAASFKANIDSYNVSTHTLRLYDYQGSFNASQNLVTTTSNAHANINTTNFLTVYGDGKAKANAIFLNGLINFPGYFQDTSGFLSSDQKLQGSNVYHAFSYIIAVEQALNDYKKLLMDLVHPAGTSMLGRFIVQKQDNRNPTILVKISVDPVVSGSVSSNAFGPGLLVGAGTQFTANANVGDKIVFNISDSSRKLQIKEIKTIANNGNLTMDSNTSFVVAVPSTINVGSNVIVGNTLFGNVAVTDIIRTKVAGNAQTSIVTATGAASVTVNTVFNINATNVLMVVYPSQNGASYSIVKATN